MNKWITLDDSVSWHETGALSQTVNVSNAGQKVTDAKDASIDHEGFIYGILLQTVREIEAGGRWKSTPEVRDIEKDINRIFAGVIAGESTVDDFRAVCKRWKAAGTA